MNTIQRIIKAFSVLVAVALSALIFAGVTKAAEMTLKYLGYEERMSGTDRGQSSENEYCEYYMEFDAQHINNLVLSTGSEKVIVENGGVFSVRGNNVSEYIVTEVEGDTLNISNASKSFLFWGEETELIITIPEDKVFDNVVLESGSGSVDISGLNSIMCIFDTGSGNVDAQNMKLEGLVIDSGSGRVSVDGYVCGTIDIDSGSGRVYLSLREKESAYSIYGVSGSGGIYISGKNYNNISIYRENPVGEIYIDGGSGRVSLEFMEKN